MLCRPRYSNTQALGLAEGELIPTHRLDEGTEGVVVIARTSAFASYFQTLLRKGAEAAAADAAASAAAAQSPQQARLSAAAAQSPQQARLVRKVYKCVTRSPGPPLGMLRHDMIVGHRFKGSPKYTAALLPPFEEPETTDTEVRQAFLAPTPSSLTPTTSDTAFTHCRGTRIYPVEVPRSTLRPFVPTMTLVSEPEVSSSRPVWGTLS